MSVNTKCADIKIHGDESKKESNESNFWELISDVAKDLDLALHDLSPDLEISNNLENGIDSEDAPTRVSTKEPTSNSILLKPLIVRIKGDDDTKKGIIDDGVNESEESVSHNNNSISDSIKTTVCADSALPLVNQSTSISLSTKTSSYSAQLLMVMDNVSCSNACNDINKCPNNELQESHALPSVTQKNCNKEGSTGEEENSAASNESIPATIGLLERLIRSHPIWFLPEIGRAGVVHLLQGKEPGCFIVRQSSKANTMALSVRLPEGRGPHIEHYLIEDGGNGKFHLEGSDNYFSAVPMLVCHYSNCCDELPVQLTLPRVLAQSTRHQLTSLALLGQDFWQSSLSKLSNSSDSTSSLLTNSMTRHTSLTTFVSLDTNNANTFKTDPPPPPVPPKQDTTDLDPIIDTKKSSTVPMGAVMTQPSTPKLPPRSVEPPPVPPRTTKLLQCSAAPVAKSSSSSSSNVTVTTTVSVNMNAQETAPNTEVTLIDISGSSAAQRLSTSSATSNSSHLNENQQQETKDNPVPQKKVACYRSLLDDKVSDYEDIWGAASCSKLNLNSTLGSIKENDTNSKLHQSTQTESRTSVKEAASRKFSSPFYMDPIDAIPNSYFRFPKIHRRSDTNINDCDLPQNKPLLSGGHSLESLIDNIKCQSLQRDTCMQMFNVANVNLQDAAIQVGDSVVSHIKSRNTRESSWPVDSSWEWLHDRISLNSDRFSTLALQRQVIAEYRRSSFVESMKSDVTTIEDLIIERAPELIVPKVQPLTKSNINSLALNNDNNSRIHYDNLLIYHNDDKKQESINNDTDTEFSEPWDSQWWEGLLCKVFPKPPLMELSPNNEDKDVCNSFTQVESKDGIRINSGITSTLSSLSGSRRTSTFDITDVSSMTELRSNTTASVNRRSSIISENPTVLESKKKGIGQNICDYILTLASEGNNTFSKTIDHFIQCTRESNETNPKIIMRNIRQFMNGMKNYLVKHGEGELDQMVQQERSKLKPNEFLNIDAILEGVMHKLVIKPLKNFLYQLFVNEYNANGFLKLLSKNIKETQSKTAVQIGVRPELNPPDHKAMVKVQRCLCKLQQEYSPLKKLEYLLMSISAIYDSVRQQQMARSKNDTNYLKSDHASFGADDFLPIFIYVLVQCGMISAEIEADYMFGLLHPSILGGEGGYYLTTLSSAVHVLKNMSDTHPDNNKSPSSNESCNSLNTSPSTSVNASQMNCSPSNSSVNSTANNNSFPSIQCKPDLQGYMKILIPDELTCSIMCKTLPVRPNMTTKEVCRMIAHKLKVTNPEDYCLFKLIDGDENMLNDSDLPQAIKADFAANGKDCFFTYKRCDAKFIWPIINSETTSTCI